MTQRSKRHHEIPLWLQKHFCHDSGETVWLGVKASREVKPVGINVAFRRNNANIRIDYFPGPDGVVVPTKSDRDELLLAKFDSVAAPAARRLIQFAREWQRDGLLTPCLSLTDLEICKQIILAQFRRTRESQDEIGLGDDKSDLFLDLYFQRAEQYGQELPPRQDLLADPQVRSSFADVCQNHRARFASADHPILAEKERGFLAPLGLRIAVVDLGTCEFVIGSHGLTNLHTTEGSDTCLPLAPDVAIALSGTPGFISIATCTSDAVEAHNRAALSISSFVAGRSREIIEGLLASLD